eukprot:3687287-Karenia_brevis.AAC.1
MAHVLIPYFCLNKIDYPEGNKRKRHQQIFVRENFLFPIVGAEWYATNVPGPTPLRGSQKQEISCMDDIFTDNVTFQQ